MENGNGFVGLAYSCGEDLNGNFVVPLSYPYTSFSNEIPNICSNVSHLSSLHHQHRPTPCITSEDKWAFPSECNSDFNPCGSSYPLYRDPSGSGLSQCPPVCYSECLLPQSGLYQFWSPTTSSHTWTPGDAVQYHTSSAERCDPIASIKSEDKQICTTHEAETVFCPLPPDIETVGQHKDSIRSILEKSKKPCHCTKSQCLKLYCDCFANGELCGNCSCIKCHNNMHHANDRNNAIKACLDRNPDAFRSKPSSGVQRDAKGSQTRGCNCKNSGCLKNYCECYKANITCSSVCKCESCSNYSRTKVKNRAEEKSSHPEHNNKHLRTKSSVSCITDTVVEATYGCLLAVAEKAEKDECSLVEAERATLQEFGYCLTQIKRFMFKHTHT